MFSPYKVFLILLLLNACGPSLPDEVADELAGIRQPVGFNDHIRSILSDRCYTCHGPDENSREADLRFDLGREHIIASSGAEVLKDLLVDRILSSDPEAMMPPPESNLELSDLEKALLIRWVDEGAKFQKHWAWTSPQVSDLPKFSTDWIRNPIDNFTFAKITSANLQPKEQADDVVLLRRLYFDLIGLPPTLEEIEQYLSTDPKIRWENTIDSLMASPHYGERMAVEWLDLSRYADTHGYTVDRYRDMSPWRDWVIEAFNNHLPYNQFVTEQLAGDMLPNATSQQILATGFNRNHPQNMEGGIVSEEFRIEYAADRANTFGTAFLGLTFGCARCHDHKYDPISQEEYFQVFSYFDNINESGQISFDNATPVPTLVLMDEEVAAIVEMLEREITDLEENMQPPSSERMIRLKQSLNTGLVAHFDFDRPILSDRLKSSRIAIAKTSTQSQEILLGDGYSGKAPVLDGDAWLDLGNSGLFDREQPFTIAMWAWIPKALKNGTIFHKGEGAILYNFRGYHVALRDNGLEVVMARTLPDNALVGYSASGMPRDQWVHLTMTYDGSSKASGLSLYVDGKIQDLVIEQDNLNKSILLSRDKNQPGLQLGARWRGLGIKDARLDEVRVYDRTLREIEVAALADKEDLGTQIAVIPSAHKKQEVELREKRRQLNHTVDSLQEVMVMKEMTQPRPTFLLDRGQYDAPLHQVTPDVPALFASSTTEQPNNRLELAEWLFDPNNPLTARVVVNRIWQTFFGIGLVETSEDFGSQGSRPSHPQLLDWLATELIQHNWDIQHIQRLIVTSATYLQTSHATAEERTADPQNRLYARGTARRLTAEMVRDNALAASGLLATKIGGPSVKPYQPAGLWKVNQSTYEEDHGENLYRRSMYTVWKRSVPHPTLHTFDAPERSECMPRRQETNTPMQSLVLLNDPTFVEAARVLGKTIVSAASPTKGIELAFRRACSRSPAAEEQQLLQDLYDQEIDRFQKDPSKMKGWLQIGESQIDDDSRRVQYAASGVVASAILNSDAAIVRR